MPRAWISLHQPVEILQRAELRRDVLVPAAVRAILVAIADGVRHARFARLAGHGVVAAFARGDADGMDRREVDHVEAHRLRVVHARRGSRGRSSRCRRALPRSAGKIHTTAQRAPRSRSTSTARIARGWTRLRRDGAVWHALPLCLRPALLRLALPRLHRLPAPARLHELVQVAAD